jgi:hypothetical protein
MKEIFDLMEPKHSLSRYWATHLINWNHQLNLNSTAVLSSDGLGLKLSW